MAARSVGRALGQLTYIGENPFDYVSVTDRYLALTDLLFDVYGMVVPTKRHRALIRIEDVSAASDPQNLRALADYLASEQVPFSVAAIRNISIRSVRMTMACRGRSACSKRPRWWRRSSTCSSAAARSSCMATLISTRT